ncbi:MAG: GNAT family N-acetyltransferase [Geminicoccaceae bacterium]
MIGNLVARNGTVADVEDLSAFLQRVWRHTYAPRHGLERVEAITRRWHGKDRLRDDARDEDAIFLVVEQEGKIVGHAFLQSRHGPVASLRRLYVDPDCQKCGIGGLMLGELMTRLDETVEMMELEVDLLGRDAIAFYRSKGFVECGRTGDCGDESGIAAMIMRRSVDKRASTSRRGAK